MPAKPLQQKPPRNGWWRHSGISLLTAVLVAMGFKSAVAELNVVPTGSMKPTIVEGDRLIVNKLAYDLKIPFTGVRLARWADPRRGEVVVFRSPVDGTRLVKRVVGVPGDRIAMHNNRLVINGKRLPLETVRPPDPVDRVVLPPPPLEFMREKIGDRWHRVMHQPARAFVRSFGPVTIPPGHFFVMGDNRDNSGDSRLFGFVPRRGILGRSTRVALSLDPERCWMPRGNRFLHPLDAPAPTGDRS
jgi:signal peptidase I